jgi:hypothetical protein
MMSGGDGGAVSGLMMMVRKAAHGCGSSYGYGFDCGPPVGLVHQGSGHAKTLVEGYHGCQLTACESSHLKANGDPLLPYVGHSQGGQSLCENWPQSHGGQGDLEEYSDTA